MSIVSNLKDYFKKKETNKDLKAPKGVCPNCWGKQEWEGEFYKTIKANDITSENNTYNNFINDVVKKLDKIVLKEDALVCETCNISHK